MTVGSLGGVVFSVSDKTVRTFKSLSWKTSATYSVHKMHGRKSLLEFTGQEPDEIEFEAEFSAFLGVNPRDMFEKLKKLCTNHKIVSFVVGTEVIGGDWIVTNVDGSADSFFQDGSMLSMSVKIKIKEYPEE